jgi:cation diffusion facilitator family transporter
MVSEKKAIANRRIKQVTYLGAGLNLFLAVLKTVVGLFAGSMALVADGIHSISDMVTDAVLLLGVYFGSKEPDPEHPYGHGRLETFSTLFIGVALVVVGGGIIQRASTAIVKISTGQIMTEDIGAGLIGVVVISIIAKEALYQLTRKVAVSVHSTALYANAWHHRSDAASSVAVLIGFVAMRFGYEHGDQIAAIVVGLMIIFVGVRIIGGCLHEFAERAVDSETILRIERIISSEGRVRQWHKLRTRSAGREIFIDVHILVDPQLNITEAHEIAESLEEVISEQIIRPVNVMVHVEPDSPEQRKQV